MKSLYRSINSYFCYFIAGFLLEKLNVFILSYLNKMLHFETFLSCFSFPKHIIPLFFVLLFTAIFSESDKLTSVDCECGCNGSSLATKVLLRLFSPYI